MIKDNLLQGDLWRYQNNVVNFVNNNTTIRNLRIEDYEVDITVIPKNGGMTAVTDGDTTWQQVRDYSSLSLYDIQIMKGRKRQYGI